MKALEQQNSKITYVMLKNNLPCSLFCLALVLLSKSFQGQNYGFLPGEKCVFEEFLKLSRSIGRKKKKKKTQRNQQIFKIEHLRWKKAVKSFLD